MCNVLPSFNYLCYICSDHCYSDGLGGLWPWIDDKLERIALLAKKGSKRGSVSMFFGACLYLSFFFATLKVVI